jgi:PIN domain
MSGKPVLFIDANQYLDLYRMVSGKKILAALEEQKDYIFVTSQVVHEVSRNKVKVAASFLANETKKIELSAMAVPDHMLSTSDDSVKTLGNRLHELHGEVTKVKDAFQKLTQDLLEQVSQSKDDVSKALTVIFSKADVPNAEELRRAKERKLLGNPPGKNNDPLGDQVSWEQILTKCKNKPSVWIITKDSDYATKYESKMFLNALLYDELTLLYQRQPEVFCFDNIADGLKHFSETTSVKAEKLPTPTETEQIKKEQDSLPPLGRLIDSSGAANAFVSPKFDLSQFTASPTIDLSQFTASPKFDLSQFAASPKFDLSQFAASPKFDLSQFTASPKFDLSQFAASPKFDLSQFAASPKLAFGASQVAEALADPNAKETLAASQVADALAGGSAPAKENLIPKEPEVKKGDS